MISIPVTQNEKMKKEGILYCLKENENENDFSDHEFIARLSNRDPYNLLDPNSEDLYCSSDNGNFYFEIEFDSIKTVNGIILKTTSRDFVKSFKVILDDENEVFTTSGIEDLNAKFSEVSINFDAKFECKKIKILQIGKNFAETNFIRFQRIDIITDEAPDGYFKSIISDFNDIHLLPVKLSFDCFSIENFYSLNTQKAVSTHFDERNEGFLEIFFINGLVFVEGYRLKRQFGKSQMKSWEIQGQQEDEGEWFLLDKREEITKSQYPACEVFEIKNKGIFKRIRIAQKDKNWNGNNSFRLIHFDIFGRYYFIQ